MGYQDKQNAHTRVTPFVYRLFINLGLFLYDENKRKNAFTVSFQAT